MKLKHTHTPLIKPSCFNTYIFQKSENLAIIYYQYE